jgi:aspartate kinase
MLEMASLGSKVLQIRSVEFASKYKVRLRVLSTFEENPQGTLICSEEELMENPVISGIAFSRDEAKLTVLGVPDRPGIAYAILKPISEANIEVDMIIQNQSIAGTTDFTFTVSRNDCAKALAILNEHAIEMGAKEVLSDAGIVKVSLVGIGMRSHAGVAARMFEVLYNEDVNIEMISTTEIKISVVVREGDLEKAVRSLHTAFDLE